MTAIKGEPTDKECSEVDAKLLGPGWVHLLDAAGLNYRERQVIGWALRVAPRLRRDLTRHADHLEMDGLRAR
jgi:hypothetical protein